MGIKMFPITLTLTLIMLAVACSSLEKTTKEMNFSDHVPPHTPATQDIEQRWAKCKRFLKAWQAKWRDETAPTCINYIDESYPVDAQRVTDLIGWARDITVDEGSEVDFRPHN